MKKERRKRRFRRLEGLRSHVFRMQEQRSQEVFTQSSWGSTHQLIYHEFPKATAIVDSSTIHQPDFYCQTQIKIWQRKDHTVRFSVAPPPIFLFQDLIQWNNNGETFLSIFCKQIHRHRYKEIKESDQKDPSQARKRRLTCSFQIFPDHGRMGRSWRS